MDSSTVNFGNTNKGKTLPQIIFSDPDWFFWAVENNVFRGKGPLEIEAKELDYKTRNICIPPGMVAEYWIDCKTKKFNYTKLVEKDRPPHEGSSETFRKDVIDLSVPRQIVGYNKYGYGNMLISVKIHLFGDRHIRLTKKRCEEFFENNDNFRIDPKILEWIEMMWR